MTEIKLTYTLKKNGRNLGQSGSTSDKEAQLYINSVISELNKHVVYTISDRRVKLGILLIIFGFGTIMTLWARIIWLYEIIPG